MASCSKFVLARVSFLQANGQQTTVSVKPSSLKIILKAHFNLMVEKVLGKTEGQKSFGGILMDQ